jgi:hypothetical protein
MYDIQPSIEMGGCLKLLTLHSPKHLVFLIVSTVNSVLTTTNLLLYLTNIQGLNCN